MSARLTRRTRGTTLPAMITALILLAAFAAFGTQVLSTALRASLAESLGLPGPAMPTLPTSANRD